MFPVGSKLVRVGAAIRRWGNSLALRITGAMAQLPRFEPGTRVTVDINSEGSVVKRAGGRLGTFRFPYSEQVLLAGMTPENAHADLLADPSDPEVEP